MADEPQQAQEQATVVIRPDDTQHLMPSQTAHGPSDDYAICGKVGDGGMGVVYLARDRRLGRYVAIKRLNEKALADPILRQRFLHEARAVAALNHAYIVHIYALGEDALGPYIVMEYVSGPAQTEVVATSGTAALPKNLTLEQYIHKQGPMTADEAVAMLLKIARTMVYAHSCGVIHRDLKPANILLDPSYEPKLVDFGLARMAPRKDQTQVEELTMPGEKLISLGYSAPELEQDASTSDTRADIYSLGAILYFLLTGRNPRYYREQDVPVFLREVMRRSLETEREQRYRTAQDFVRALTEAASHGRIAAPTVKTTWRCKWCDAVNPISTKFCAECGWDGSERCLECGAEIFIGQQYCTSCGADCRMYEHVDTIVKLMNAAWEERHFERIATIAGRLHGFEPAGPTGRKILTTAHERVEEAERRVARRNRLATLIPSELKAENFERAQNFIEEFRTLNEDPLVYEEELKQIPTQILNRDLVRIRQCIRTRDWTTARHLIDSLASKYGSLPEYQDVRRLLTHHDHQREKLRWCWGGALIVALYLLSLPWTARLSGGTLGRGLQIFYTPAKWFACVPGVDYVASHYNRLCGIPNLETCFQQISSDRPQVVTTRLPREVEQMRMEFETQLNDIEASRKQLEMTLLVQYRQSLADLRHHRQEAGDYDGVIACDKAIAAFNASNTISEQEAGDTTEVVELKQRFTQLKNEQLMLYARQITASGKKILASLDELRKTYTQKGEMEPAGQISEEIARIKALKSFSNADTLLQKLAAVNGNAILPSSTVPGETMIAELDQLNASREKMHKKIESIDKENEVLMARWPKEYAEQLANLMENFRRSGNFNAWEATSLENARFETEKTLPQDAIVEYPELLCQLQQTTFQQQKTLVKERNAAVLAVYSDYIHKLEAWKIDLTKQGAMDAAATINNELKRLLKSSEYLTATGHPPKPPLPPPVTTVVAQPLPNTAQPQMEMPPSPPKENVLPAPPNTLPPPTSQENPPNLEALKATVQVLFEEIRKTLDPPSSSEDIQLSSSLKTGNPYDR